MIAEDSPDPESGLRLLVAVATANAEKLAVGLDRLFSSAPGIHRRTEGEVVVWQKTDAAGEVILAVCVAHGHLLIAHDARLLDKVLSTNRERAAAIRR
jgi:hypothetical protein